MDVAAETKLDPDRELMADRATELAEYFGITPDEAVAMYRAYHVDKVRKAPSFRPGDMATLVQSYTEPSRLEGDLSRLMLHYTRLDMAAELLAFFERAFPRERRDGVRVVDYGCGAADFGLAFALRGFEVTLVDIEGGKIEFASWRFRRRSLRHETIAINAETEYPRLEGVDVVLAGDLLEHLRDPRVAIQRVHDGLRPGGYFWFPDFPFKAKSIGGQHLQSAADLRDESAALVLRLFKRAGPPKHVMRRL